MVVPVSGRKRSEKVLFVTGTDSQEPGWVTLMAVKLIQYLGP